MGRSHFTGKNYYTREEQDNGIGSRQPNDISNMLVDAPNDISTSADTEASGEMPNCSSSTSPFQANNVNSSIIASEKIKSAQVELSPSYTVLKLVSVCETRWWSTNSLVGLKAPLLLVFLEEFHHCEMPNTETELKMTLHPLETFFIS